MIGRLEVLVVVGVVADVSTVAATFAHRLLIMSVLWFDDAIIIDDVRG